jgi:hypothetical protein
MNLFGKKKAAPAPKLNDSIQALREAMNVLDKREKHLEKQRDAALGEAKKRAKAKDKRGEKTFFFFLGLDFCFYWLSPPPCPLSPLFSLCSFPFVLCFRNLAFLSF